MKMSDEVRRILNEAAEQLKLDSEMLAISSELLEQQNPKWAKMMRSISEMAEGKMTRIYESLD
jgi:hypothetical protein